MTKRTTKDAAQTDMMGLAPEVEVPKLTPAIMPGDLGIPVVAKYLGYEVKHSRQFNREQRLYQFQLPQDFGGLKFSLWSQTQLDLKFRNIPRKTVVLIQYLGRDDSERAQHNWSIRQFRGTSAQLQELIGASGEGCGIAQQAISMIAQSMNGNSTMNDDDDDLPF